MRTIDTEVTMYVVTIDTGTTNTRICIWKNDAVLAKSSRPIGVRNTAITGNTHTLISAIKEAIDEALEQAKISSDEQITYLASGMITSNLGLHEISHLVAPVGLNEISERISSKIIPEISSQPIWFIPGVKNNADSVTSDNYEAMDMMRGEETEAIGVLDSNQLQGPALIALPGSHSKFVKIDQFNRIEGCITTIAGELLDVITKNTILANSLHDQFANEIDKEALLLGAKNNLQVGLARSCFSIRVLDMFGDLTINQKANILLGSILQEDLQAIKNSKALNLTKQTKIVICGKSILRDGLAELIKHDPYFTGDVITIDSTQTPLSLHGALAIAKHKNII